METRHKTAIWGVAAVIAFVGLAFLSPPIPRTKARASRVSGVNNVRSVSLVITNTSALPSGQPGTGK
jgi:hypothetical protein